MILPFNETIINDGKINKNNFNNPNFVGYLNPKGIPIKFDDKYGYVGHGETPSVQSRFRTYYNLKYKDFEFARPIDEFKMSFEYLHSEKKRYEEALKDLILSIKTDYEFYKKFEENPKIEMELDIYNFLLNCYRADTFFEGIGKIEFCMSEEEFYQVEFKRKYPNKDIDDWEFSLYYSIYRDKVLADIFKNVMIQYLGYHSVERIPRTITTSDAKIYSTFYNYLLNDFNIVYLSKMIYDKSEKKYIEYNQNEFFLPDSELRLKDEIETIKKLVPQNERYLYYR